MSNNNRCTCLEVYGEDPNCVSHGIGTDHWAQAIVENPVARVHLVERLRCHDRRISELLAANNREVERRRAAEGAAASLREQVERLGGSPDA